MAELLDERVLLEQAREGDSDAVDQLLTRYKDLVRSKASLMYMAGADSEDVIQEGMIGLYKAICAYQPEKQVPFQAFASYCILTQITDAVRRAARQKHQLLNQSVSLHSLTDPGNQKSLAVSDVIADTREQDPEQRLLDRERVSDLLAFVQADLSRRERQCLLLLIQNLSYQQIADILDVSVKTVDNALGRARRKIRQFRSDLSESDNRR